MDGSQTTLLPLNGSINSPANNLLKRSNNTNIENNVVNSGNKLTSLIFSSRSPSPQEQNGGNSVTNGQPKPNQVSIAIRSLLMS
jgi:hypothetical protein